MTVTTSAPSGGGEAAVPPEDLVSLTIDGIEISVPKGTLVIRAAELLGIEIPRFCDHPLLDPAGACRQCIVEVEGQRKPMASCTITCTDGMVVKTQLTSPVAEKAQRGVMELLLINHPLDCPVCDKGGECPLQNQAMSTGSAESRFEGQKRTYEKPVPISTQVLLDRERCVLCARCTRFSNQIAGDPMIELIERGALQQVGTGEGDPFESYFSGNTIQICPVGALTGAAYRFRSRPFDLVSSPERVRALRRRLRDPHRPPARQGHAPPRRRRPRGQRGVDLRQGPLGFRLRHRARPPHHPAGAQRRRRPGTRRPGPRPWRPRPAGLPPRAAGPGSSPAAGSPSRTPTRTASSRGSPSTPTTSTSAPGALGRGGRFLAARVAGRGVQVVRTPRWRRRPVVLLVGFEPEEEAPGVFLRLRKAARKHGQRTFSLAPYATRGLEKHVGRAASGRARQRGRWHHLDHGRDIGRCHRTMTLLNSSGAVIIVGRTARGQCPARCPPRPAGRRHRRRAGVDPAPGGRTRRAGGGRTARAAARRPARDRSRARASRFATVWQSGELPSRRAATPARS